MGRWLAALRNEEKKLETAPGGTDKTNETPSIEVLSVSSGRHQSVSEKIPENAIAEADSFVSSVRSPSKQIAEFSGRQPPHPVGLEISHNRPDEALTKPTELPAKGFVSFDSSLSEQITKILSSGNAGKPVEQDQVDIEERAAILEFDGGLSRAEAAARADTAAELAARLDQVLAAGPLPDMPEHRWQVFTRDAPRLCTEWGVQAQLLGWSIDDLLGHDPVKPWQRIDRLGLAWLLDGSSVMAMDEKRARLGHQTFTRRDARHA